MLSDPTPIDTSVKKHDSGQKSPLRIKNMSAQQFVFRAANARETDFGVVLSDILADIWKALGALESVTLGPAIVRYRMSKSATIAFDAGFPVLEDLPASAAYQIGKLDAGRVATWLHWGSYELLPDVWQQFEATCEAQSLLREAERWEIYWVDATQTEEVHEIRTELVWRLRAMES